MIFFKNFKIKLTSWLIVSMLIGIPFFSYPTTAENLPELNDSASQALNAQDELILGKRLMADARARLNLIDDPILESYIKALTHQLAVHSSRTLPDINISIALNPIINAFAAPGGQIAINTGLLTATQSEGEFASVIAHEISHHSQRHIPRMLENAKKASLPSTAAVLGGLLIGGQVGIATIATVRGYEQEADAAGMKLLAKAGFDPTQMPTFFERLEKQSQIQGGEGPEFLRTHPLSGNRIAEAHSRVKSLNLFVEDRAELSTLLNFELAQNRAIALYGEPLDKITDTFKSALKLADKDSRFAPAYGLSLAYLRSGDTQLAAQSIDQSFANEAQHDLAMLTQAEIAIKDDNKPAAIGLLDKLIVKHPKNLAVGLTRARTLKRMGRLDDAFQQARKMMRTFPDQPQAKLLLADIAGADGNLAQAAFHKSEFYYNLGHYKKAARVLTPYASLQSDDISNYLASSIKDLQHQISQADARATALKL
jgi:predicted Zn-dependent protease